MKTKRRIKGNLKDKNLTLWPEDTARHLPDNYDELQNLDEEVVNDTVAKFESHCKQRLARMYLSMGNMDAQSLLAKLNFAVVILVEQTTAEGLQRDFCERLRKLHKERQSFPSLATIYRSIAPLKVWLQRKCKMKKPLTVRSLRADRRPLLLITNESLKELADECNSFRNFAKKYRPRRKSGQSSIEPSDLPDDSTTPNAPRLSTKSPTGACTHTESSGIKSQGLALISGQLDSAQLNQIKQMISGKAELIVLSELAAKGVRRLLSTLYKEFSP